MGPLTTLLILSLFFLLSEISSLSWLFLLTLSFVFLSVALLSSSTHYGLISFLLLILFLIVCTFVSTYSLLVFFISYELSLFPVCLIILLEGYQPEKIKAILYLLLYTVVCSAPFFYFTIFLNTSISSGFATMEDWASILVCLSFMVKSPLYTLHSWLPNAHVEASLIGSMLLAGVILNLGSYGLLILAPNMLSFSPLFVYLTLSGGIICSVICCRNWDMKSLVAYSSVVHIGVVTLGALSGLELGFWVACGMMVGHSLLSPLLFILTFEMYLASGSRSFLYGHSSSVSCSLLFVISFCSGLNFGLPPFLNFWVEVSVFSLMGSLWSLSLIPLLLSAFLSFLYSILLYLLSCGGASSQFLPSNGSLYLYLPSITFSLVLAFSPSVLLF